MKRMPRNSGNETVNGRHESGDGGGSSTNKHEFGYFLLAAASTAAVLGAIALTVKDISPGDIAQEARKRVGEKLSGPVAYAYPVSPETEAAVDIYDKAARTRQAVEAMLGACVLAPRTDGRTIILKAPGIVRNPDGTISFVVTEGNYDTPERYQPADPMSRRFVATGTGPETADIAIMNRSGIPDEAALSVTPVTLGERTVPGARNRELAAVVPGSQDPVPFAILHVANDAIGELLSDQARVAELCK
jgi:hypothetical protein